MKISCDAIHIGFLILYKSKINNKEKVKMIGIYLITNNINGKVYIGQSIDINRRYA